MANDQAWAEGWQLGKERSDDRHAHKQALSEMELEGKISELIDNRKAIQGKLPTLLDANGNPTPEYDTAIQQLTQNARDLREVYHPNKNPNAVQQFGHLLTDALHITSPEERAKKEGDKRAAAAIGDEKEAESLAAAAPLSATQQGTQKGQGQAAEDFAYFNAAMKNYDQQNPHAVGPDATDEEKQARQDYSANLLQRLQGSYTKPNMKFFTVPGSTTPIPLDMNHPESWPVGAVPYEKETIAGLEIQEFKSAVASGYTGTIMQFKADSTKSKALESQWIRAHYGGRDLDQLTPQEADQAIAKFREENTGVTTSTGQTLIYDQNNQPHVFTHTTTSRKIFPGGGSVAAAAPVTPSATSPSGATVSPKTPEDVKRAAAKLNPPSPSNSKTTKSPIGPPLDFHKMTPEITAANKKYLDAVGLVTLAENVKKHPKNAQEQRDFAILMERTMSGRFQTAAYDLEVKNSGIANTFDQWVNNLSTGALPQHIIEHLVQTAHDYKDSMAKEVEEAKGTSETTAPSSTSDMSDDEFLMKAGK